MNFGNPLYYILIENTLYEIAPNSNDATYMVNNAILKTGCNLNDIVVIVGYEVTLNTNPDNSMVN